MKIKIVGATVGCLMASVESARFRMKYNNQEFTMEDLENFTEQELKIGLEMLQEQIENGEDCRL